MEHKTKDWVRILVGPQGPLLATVKRRKLAWFGHVTCHGSPSKTILQAPWRVDDAVIGRKIMLGGQHQRVDISARARSAHKGLLQKRLKEDLC